LKLLLVLTVADIRAVGPNIWNGWKAALMRDLYHRCDAVLRGADLAAVALGNADEAQRKVRAMLTSWTDSELQRMLSNCHLSIGLVLIVTAMYGTLNYVQNSAAVMRRY